MEKTKPDTTKACIHQSKKISKEKCRKKDKWGSMQYKQTIYVVPKSKIKSRAHYNPEPAWGTNQ